MSDIRPDFVNEQGFEWYIHKDLCKYADSLGLAAMYLWRVIHADHPTYFVATKDCEVVAEAQTVPGIKDKLKKLQGRYSKPLRETVDDLWSSHEQFPKEQWKAEVANDDTHLGYWEWVESQLEQQ